MSDKPIDRVIRAIGGPYRALLLTLVVMLVVYPYIGKHRAVDWAFDLIMLGVVAASLQIGSEVQLRRRLIWLLGLSAFISGFLARSVDLDPAYPFGAGLRALFMGYLIVLIFSDIMRRKSVTFDAVLGASCVLVMLSFTFGSLYALLDWMEPGTFSFPAAPDTVAGAAAASSREYALQYFSLVSLTTIGFGDITPVGPSVRNLAAIEGLLGQLYLAVIIARIVGLEVASRLQDRGPPSGS